MNQLPIFLNLKGRRILLLGHGVIADAKRRLYERAGAVITDDENADQLALAVVALESEAEAIAAVKRLNARGLLVNAVDRPALCDFTTPAIIDRGPVLVAIGTGGASAGLAKALRQRLEQLMPATLGTLAVAMFNARDRIQTAWPEATARRKAIDAVLNPGGALDAMGDHTAEDVDLWLAQPHGQARSQVVDLELASEDPDDLTLRQARWLGQADQIFASSDVPEQVLARARADAQRFALSLWDEQPTAGLTLRIRMKR